MVRLLTNLETNKAKLLQIILIGQPELDHVLAREELRQLDQRINARYHLGPLNKDQVAEYVSYRLGVAGCQRALFSRQAIRRIFRLSRGVPRIINVLCDHSLLRAYASSKELVNASLVSSAAREVLAARKFVDSDKALVYGKAIAATVLVAALVWTIPKYVDYRSMSVTEVASSDLGTNPISAPNLADSEMGVELQEQAVVAEPESVESGLDNRETTSEQAPILATVRSTESEAPSQQELDTLLSDWSAQDSLTDLAQDTGIARVTLPSLLSIHPDKFDRDSAYESLATLWGVRLSLNESQFEICDAVRAVELECLPGRGDWRSIERFNRPGVLVLSVGAKSIRLVLQSMEDDVVTVRLAGTSYELERNEIDQYWNGQYMVFWKPPPVDSEQLVPGKRGAAVI
jgi:general secretion pathway protein A